MTYVSNSPLPGLEDQSRFNFEQAVRIYALPAWIYKSFTAKYPLSEIHTYGKLREVASIVDVAQINILTNMLECDGHFSVAKTAGDRMYYPLDSVIESSFWKVKRNTVTDEERAEIVGTVCFYTNDAGVKASLVDRLKVHDDGMALCEASFGFPLQAEEPESTPFKVVVLNNSLYIIVEEGFLSYMENLGNRKAFLTQVLKSAYAVAPVGIVNRSVFYEQYVKALAE